MAALAKGADSSPATMASLWSCLLPKDVLHWPKISNEAKLVYCWLRAEIGAESGSMTVNFGEIAMILGKTESRARAWIKQLIDVGLVERKDGRRGRGGAIDLYVVDYVQIKDLRRIDDPQADQPQLFETVACAPKSSETIALTIAHPTILDCSQDVNEKNIPRNSSNEKTKSSARETSGAPFASMDTIESKDTSKHKPLNTMVPCFHGADEFAHPQSNTTISNRAERQAMADIDSRILEAQSHAPPDPPPLANVVARAIDRYSDRSKYDSMKAQIIVQIDRSVIDPNLDPSIKGRVADAVLAAELSDEKLNEILRYVQMKTRAGEIKKTPGTLFLFLVRKSAPSLRHTKGNSPCPQQR